MPHFASWLSEAGNPTLVRWSPAPSNMPRPVGSGWRRSTRTGRAVSEGKVQLARNALERLRAAYDMFGAIGMEAFPERARRELIATGETVGRRSAETCDQL